MAGTSATVYLKCCRNVEMQEPDVYLKDLGTVHCANPTICAKLKALKVWHFQKKEARICVINVLKLIAQMEKACPGITVESVGEPDIVLEWVDVSRQKSWRIWPKVILVCLVSFFGTAFTIMAYHNDIGINAVFTEVYKMVMGREPESYHVLEISYSLGLAVGIILFFNHVGGRRITRDTTPIEVAMKLYERDVDDTLIETADREGKEIE